ncbi:MAG: beta-ketoacyl-ACP synthase III [Candidatus Latescibacterota bacterium]
MQKLRRGSRIIGTGRFCPEKILSNSDLEKIVDTSDEWIQTRTGIKERRLVEDHHASSDIGLFAAQEALKDAKVRAEDLDCIIVGTVTPDMQFPSTACFVQDRLGAKNAAAFDLGAACSGFIYGVSTAHAMIVSGQMERVLVVGVEVLSKFVDWKDRATCVLFGDGAGAVVIEACDPGEGILASYIKADGSLSDLLMIPAGGSRQPLSQATYESGDQYIKMKGDGVFKYAVRAMVDAAHVVLKQTGFELKDVAHLIPHQANIRIIDSVISRLGIEPEKVVINVDRYGNTSSATIPIALDELCRSDKIKNGDVVLLVAFGGGLTWGSILFKHTASRGQAG